MAVGATGEREGPEGWDAQLETLVDSVACYAGGYPAAPSCFGIPSSRREVGRSHLLRQGHLLWG